VPKTGGNWVQSALSAAGVPLQLLERAQPGVVSAHAGLAATADYADRFTLAYVRHPLDWWRSFWVYRMRTGWVDGHSIDANAHSSDFNEFIAQVVTRLPGHLEHRFAMYIGERRHPISYIGRCETLLDDLVDALRSAGEPFDEAALRAQPPVNVGDYRRFPALYEPELAVALARAEQSLIGRFYPDDPVPQHLVAV
jgi:hypothetical protein